MSSATALTIIAISVVVLAIVAVVAIIFLMRLVIHLIAFERTLVNELAELRQLAAQLRETTERVGKTVHDVQAAARRVGGVVGAVASLVLGRSATKAGRQNKLRPWWMTGASLGWKIIQKRRQKKKQQSKMPMPAGQDNTLPM